MWSLLVLVFHRLAEKEVKRNGSKKCAFPNPCVTGDNGIIAFTLLLVLSCNMDATLLLKLLCCATSRVQTHAGKCNFRGLTGLNAFTSIQVEENVSEADRQ